MDLVAQAALIAHIASGSVAILLGLLPILAPKGRPLHVRTGRWFVRVMYLVLGSAVGLTLIFMKPYFAALTMAATIGVFSGARVLKRKRPDLRAVDRARPLDWGVTLGVAGLAVFLALQAAGGEIGNNATVFYALIGGTLAYCAYDLVRFAAPRAWPFFPGLWFYEHLVKMLGAYSAVVAAFSGSVLHFLPIPEPWKQLWSTILFHNLMLAMIAWYAVKRRRAARAAAGAPA